MEKFLISKIFLVLILLIGIFSFYFLKFSKKNQLEKDIDSAKSFMWIGPHPDDELYSSGTWAYLANELGKEFTIISFFKDDEFLDANLKSAKLLGDAEYRWIFEDLGIDNIGDVANQDGIGAITEPLFTYLVDLLQEKKPDIVFTFEPTNGYRSVVLQHMLSSQIVKKAIKASNVDVDHYYILNRDRKMLELAKGKNKKLDPLPVTDIINLDDKLWSYKMQIYEYYSLFYPELKQVVENEDLQAQLSHKEYFRKVK